MHFPFPGNGRWTALGSRQLPVDFALSCERGSLADFALADCWSLGGAIPVGAAAQGEAEEDEEEEEEARGRRVKALQEAFAEGDAFVCVHAPAGSRESWESRESCRSGPRFAASKPAVLWEQNAVRAVASAGPPLSNEEQAEDCDDEDTHARALAPTQVDLYGRSLPLHRVGSRAPTSEGARFVRQLQTESLVAQSKAKDQARAEQEEGKQGEGEMATHFTFELLRGTLLHDASDRGDADAVLGGRVAVSLAQTWPAGHPFSLLDTALAEALREGAEKDGLPAWLCTNLNESK